MTAATIRRTTRIRPARIALLTVVFVVAACGLVYELALISLGSFLIGSTVRQASIVLGVLVFAMGLGSLAAKPFQRRPVEAFAAAEVLIGLIGGISVLGLYAAFAWLDLYNTALIAVSLVLGLLVGLELPLLMTLLQRIRSQDAGEATADLFAADYTGALAGGLLFPFVLLPWFGQLTGALAVGALNIVAAAFLVLVVFRRSLSTRNRALIACSFALALALLAVTASQVAHFEVQARQALFRDPIVHAQRTDYQEIVLTEQFRFEGRKDLRLFLNGDLQFSSIDEYRYHESLVHPTLTSDRSHVLILGGGDGLAAREVLRHADVEHVTLVELDPQVVELSRHNPRLRSLNEGALDDARLEVVEADAFSWLRETPGRFDAVIVDMPDPDDTATAKLYSVEFYELIGAALGPDGTVTTQAGSPFFAPEAFWSIDAGLRAAGFLTVPYHVEVPSFGNWGFVAASRDRRPRLDVDPAVAPSLRFLDRPTLSAATVFPRDQMAPDVRPSTLLDPAILTYTERGWNGE